MIQMRNSECILIGNQVTRKSGGRKPGYQGIREKEDKDF